MRTRIIKGIKVIVFLIGFLMLYEEVNNILIFKDANTMKVESFLKQREDSIEVVFIGSSHVYYAVQPMQLWKDYGIASHNFATPSQTVALAYYAVKEAIERQHPKVVVVDIYKLQEEQKVPTADGRGRVLIDRLSMTNKIEAVTDIYERDVWVDYFIPISYYHSRWQTLNETDFNPDNTVALGAKMGKKWRKFDDFTEVIQTKSLPINQDTTAVFYFKKIIQLCKENDTELLAVTLPYYCDENEQMQINGYEEFFQEQGVTYLNLFHKNSEIKLDYTYDMSDSQHLNIIGAQKVTSYLGDYLKTCYELKDVSNDKNYVKWDEDYREYEKKKKSAIKLLNKNFTKKQ